MPSVMAIPWTPRLLLALALSAAACMIWLGAATASGAPVASASAAKKCKKAKAKAKKSARKKRARCRGRGHRGTKNNTSATTSNLPFLHGLTKAWGDDASRSNPVESGRWDLYSCQRRDGQQSSSTSASELVPGRFSQFSSGGPNNKRYYHFYAPQGDNIWTPGSAGRCELGYPVVDPGNAPALALEQRSGNWMITSFGGPTIWSMPASAGGWVNFAFDITYSGDASNGRVKVYADTNNDGTYEYSSNTWSGRTLFQQNGTGVESAYINGLYEGVGGDTIDKADMSIWS